MLIVTLPASAASAPRSFILAAKRQGADMVELRSDLTPRLPFFRSPLPLVLALRTQHLDPSLSALRPAIFDCDLSLIATWQHLPSDIRTSAKLLISHHEYRGTPTENEMKKIVQKMCSLKPWGVKIATTIRSMQDLEHLVQWREKLSKKFDHLAVIGMGPLGHLTRVLGAAQGDMTYGCIDAASASAPGQLPLSFLRCIRPSPHPAIFGLIGGPHIVHSESPAIHNAYWQQERMDAVYAIFPVDDLRTALPSLRRMGVLGLSVTAPFKRDAAAVARTCEPLVQELGVANTLVWHRGGWRAALTDVDGIAAGYPCLREASSMAILGAGGVVPSVIAGLRAVRPDASVTVFARHVTAAKRVLASANVTVAPLSHAKGFACDVVVCAVSQDVALPMPAARIAIDLRYGSTTRFLASARRHRMHTFDGLPMLREQARGQIRRFLPVLPQTKAGG